MTVYIDLLLILNFIYDFLLLMTVSVTLKRNASYKRLLLGALFGTVSTLTIFLKIEDCLMLLIKIISGIFMLIITFKYKDIKYTMTNIIYLYMCSVILAGFLYFLKIEFKDYAYLISLLVAPIILYIYVRETKKLKEIVNFYTKVTINFKNNRSLVLNGFIDSGNKLKDPITNKHIILINKKTLDGIYNIRSPIYVPIRTVNKKSLLECISIKNIIINNKVYDGYLLGLSDEFKMNDGVDCLLNYNLWEKI